MRRLVIDFVVPGYNESRRIEKCVAGIRDYLATTPHTVKVIFSLEKCTDDTHTLAAQFCGEDERFVILKSDVHRGKGFAVRNGVFEANADYTFFFDLDLATPLSEVDRFLEHFETHPECNFITGDRKSNQSQITQKQPVPRRVLSWGWLKFNQLMFSLEVRDTQCGFKAFRGTIGKDLFAQMQVHGFAFDVELLFLAQKYGLHVASIPIAWADQEFSTVQRVRDSLKMLRDLFRIRFIHRYAPSLTSSNQSRKTA